MITRGTRRRIGYFLLLKQDADKLYYLRWSYDDKPIIDTLHSSILNDVDMYRPYCRGNLFPCLFRAKIIKVWRNTVPKRYDIALRVLKPDMITKVVNHILSSGLMPEFIDKTVAELLSKQKLLVFGSDNKTVQETINVNTKSP